ncbi:hypothetical protein OGAPHI_007189 [Ogataea philodendri]|uniref:3-hydroxy-3-methylglutaryl coenzyme A reductase n=2 Tax=Ogataea TaxID=461281 RepID=A0A9P8NVV0_9ASCO|nr:uncharacterized protein OGAPHI_007189 [Ogataea philodendri]KAH3659984.1 hypothetical protein OGAPHI_007189 [Ogataea philodendri]
MASKTASVCAYLARVCANRPIHFIISTALVASITYLSILDHYATSLNADSSKPVSFYHPSGSSDYNKWVQVENLSDYDSIDHYALTPIKFKRVGDSSLPVYDNMIVGMEENEKILVSDYSSTDSLYEQLETLSGSHDTEFKLRSSHRIGRYYEYIKSLFSKVGSLIKGAEPFDIILVTVAYGAMWFTFAQLFFEMKKLGSNFWLAFGSLLSSGIAFLFALAIGTTLLNLKVPLISLSEGLPFLVATIGFKHKIAFTAPVLKALNSRSGNDVPQVISDVVKFQTAIPLIKDQSIIIACFLLCSILAPNLTGLVNFCVMSALILAVDLFFTFTFYSSILSLKAQINKVHKEIELKQFLEEDGIDETVAERVASSTELTTDLFHHDSSIVSFKVAMIVGFISLHLFALGTSWLYDDSADYEPVNLFSTFSPTLSKSVALNVPIGKHGTLVTVMPTRIYSKVDLFTQAEDFAFHIFGRMSTAISDPLVGKFLFVLAGISVSINIYLLNATNAHLTETHAVKKAEKKREKIERSKVANIPKPAAPVVIPRSSNSSSDDIKEAQIIDESLSDDQSSSDVDSVESKAVGPKRSIEELAEILKAGNVKECTDDEVVELVTTGKLPLYALEKQLVNKTRAVVVRRKAIAKLADAPVLNTTKLPWKHYDYDRVFGACCENVIGFMPLPVGVAGPMIIDKVPYHIPMATTEGCLVASTMRGCKAINAGGGVQTVLTNDGMTRGPCISFPTLARTGAAKIWLDSEEGQKVMKSAFNSTSRFARLQHLQTAMAGTLLFIRFKTTTGDAMGMNMISKGVEYALNYMVKECGFEDMEVISLSGNYCTDKKAAAINWIEGRGKSVVAAAIVPADVVRKVLKSDVDALVELNVSKNLIGSAMAGSVGGFNAHAANLVTAVYLATGQDPAQNVESSNCITLMSKLANGDLQISVSMPSIEVGTIGGGTVLEPQGAMLELLGVRGPHPTEPGANARQLAKIVASAVLAAELSLCSALAAGHLVQSHMTHNRKAPAADGAATATSSAPDVKRLQEGSKICIRS